MYIYGNNLVFLTIYMLLLLTFMYYGMFFFQLLVVAFVNNDHKLPHDYVNYSVFILYILWYVLLLYVFESCYIKQSFNKYKNILRPNKRLSNFENIKHHAIVSCNTFE